MVSKVMNQIFKSKIIEKKKRMSGSRSAMRTVGSPTKSEDGLS